MGSWVNQIISSPANTSAKPRQMIVKLPSESLGGCHKKKQFRLLFAPASSYTTPSTLHPHFRFAPSFDDDLLQTIKRPATARVLCRHASLCSMFQALSGSSCYIGVFVPPCDDGTHIVQKHA